MSTNDVHRLSNFEVEEVSVVDRAANRRRFLIVKREGDMSDLRSNGRGGFTRVAKGDDEEDTEKAKKPPFGGNKAPPFGKPADDDKDEESKSKKSDDEDEEKKKQFEGEEDDADEKKSKSKKADPQGMQLAGEVGEIAEALKALASDMKDEEADEPSDVHMKKLLACHKKMGAACEKYMSKASKSAVAKIGAKMAKARLEQFRKALDTLQGLLSELMETPGSAKDHAADPGDPQKAPAGWSPSNPSDAPTNAKGAATLKAMAGAMNELLGIAKSQAAEIAKLKKGVPGSNAIPVEKSGKAGGSPSVTVWPMDLNAGSRSGRVAKAEKDEDSFDD